MSNVIRAAAAIVPSRKVVSRPPKAPPIPAALLRQVVLETLRRLRDPKAYDAQCFANTADGKSVNVWDSKAVIFGELGHVWRAAESVFVGMSKRPLIEKEKSAVRAADLIDAQVRYITASGAADWARRGITLVSLGIKGGRLALIHVLEQVAERLTLGDEALLSPPVFHAEPEDEEEVRKKSRKSVVPLSHPDVLP